MKFPSADRWVIKITRLSDDISNSDTKNAGDTYFTSVQEIQSADVAYNNIALLGIRVRATDQLSGSTPTVTAVINGRLIRDVRNLNAEPSASANPANILYDLITNTRYGAGKYISPEQIDLESFQEFADFCDEIVYSEEEDGGTLTATPRFEINLVVDKEFRLTEIIHKICSSCRSVAVWNGDKIRIAIDKKKCSDTDFLHG
ncbi:MAG: hypothetical protein LRY50_04930 [Geovibrio sp.]|nr:hypothetical protein [Geovibrio sp.]